MRLLLDLQMASSSPPPPRRRLVRFARAALADIEGTVRLGLRVVDEGESAGLNERYRQKRGPTNVLSFPYGDSGERTRFLGDLVVCAPVVEGEARASGIPLEAHWAHMVIHGIMHLRGYDHMSDADASVMERMESQVLRGLGFADPYHKL